MHTPTAAKSQRDLPGNIILLRGSKLGGDGSHHVLLKSNLVMDDGGSDRKILLQQTDVDGLVLHSVKPLGTSGGPIFLLSNGDGGGGHILIQVCCLDLLYPVVGMLLQKSN